VRLGCAQYGGGGVVSMSDGAVTFKGGSITNTKAPVRTRRDARSHAGTGCRMLRRLRRAVCGARCVGMRDSMVRSSCAVSAACRMPHLGMGRGFMRLVACRCTLCWGRRADAFAERAARCTRVQGYGGGVIAMDNGAALFDGVAISGTGASVRAGGKRWVPGPMRVGVAWAV
jgi:hypothetical protein